MNFTSITFLLFILVVFIIYFFVNKRRQWVVLLIASYAFYLFSDIRMVLFLIITTTSIFYAGLKLEQTNSDFNKILAEGGNALTREQKNQYKSINNVKKTKILLIILMINFGILAILKYFNFFALNVNFLLSQFSIDMSIPTLRLLLPLGISFYTFQSAGYIIDVYRGKVHADTNIAKFALFVSFFPQIVQGPISRYDSLAHQLFDTHKFDYIRVKFGLQLILWGFFKKMVIADRLALGVDLIFNNFEQFEGITIFFGAVLYSIQVYCDFSGGIDIARGIAEIMGINLTNNFNHPFFATSLEDYWRRWHITLGSWMRDYIFYPLSLSKTFTKLGKVSRKILGRYLGKLFPTFLAMQITFLIVGIWHGPQWKFVAFGLYYGFLIFSGILLKPVITQVIAKFHIKTECFSWRLFKITGTLMIVCIGRYFSRADSLKDALRMLKRTFSAFNPWVLFDGTFLNLGLDIKDINLLLISIITLFVVEIFQEKGVFLRQKISEQNLVFRWSIYITAIFAILIFGVYGIGYEGSDFIYKGF